MEATLDIHAVKAFWNAQAQDTTLGSEAVTHRDHQQRLLEIEWVLKHLPKGGRLLDVGCGNGYATALFAPNLADIHAVDYSEAMIERAKREHAAVGNIRWEVQDALKLVVPSGSFDAAVTLRCLINLGSWEAQKSAIVNIHRALRPGGIFLMGEGTRQGRASLNEARIRCGLAPMPPVAYNLDFDEGRLWPFLKDLFEVQHVERLGLYDLISRIVHPLVVFPEQPVYHARINAVGRQISGQISGFDELAREFIAVLSKR
jgi:ubiquinone/menaquinone biosynthesis C-methylase UbiE